MAGRFVILGAGLTAKTGEWDKDNYTRRLPGRPDGIVSVCKKPKYSKKQRKEMAERPAVKRFCQVTAEASAIMRDPVLRKEWEERHLEFQRAAKKAGEYPYTRFWDYLRHTLNQAKIEAEKGIQN